MKTMIEFFKNIRFWLAILFVGSILVGLLHSILGNTAESEWSSTLLGAFLAAFFSSLFLGKHQHSANSKLMLSSMAFNWLASFAVSILGGTIGFTIINRITGA